MIPMKWAGFPGKRYHFFFEMVNHNQNVYNFTFVFSSEKQSSVLQLFEALEMHACGSVAVRISDLK